MRSTATAAVLKMPPPPCCSFSPAPTVVRTSPMPACRAHSSMCKGTACEPVPAELQLQPGAHRRAHLPHASLPHAQQHVHEGYSACTPLPAELQFQAPRRVLSVPMRHGRGWQPADSYYSVRYTLSASQAGALNVLMHFTACVQEMFMSFSDICACAL